MSLCFFESDSFSSLWFINVFCLFGISLALLREILCRGLEVELLFEHIEVCDFTLVFFIFIWWLFFFVLLILLLCCLFVFSLLFTLFTFYWRNVLFRLGNRSQRPSNLFNDIRVNDALELLNTANHVLVNFENGPIILKISTIIRSTKNRN